MKKIYLIILMIIGSMSFSIGQNPDKHILPLPFGFGNDVLDPSVGNLKSTYDFTPNPSGAKKNIRLILHFLLKDDGTGNFNELNDGLIPSNNYSGYDFAEYIVDYMNQHMSNPQAMRIQPFGPIPVYDCEYRFELAGTFFWRSTTNYNTGLSTLQNTYGKNTDECLNIFLINNPTASYSGYVRYLGDNAILSAKHYNNYKAAVQHSNSWYNDPTQKLLNHEIGHCFNLHHTLMTGGGICSTTHNDYCDDTPTIQDLLNIGQPSPCCWNDTYCSNNLMDYNANNSSLTPDQLGRIHEELDNEKYYFWRNHFINSQIDICVISSSNTYIANKVTIPNSCSTTINNGVAIFINASEVEIHPGFTVMQGGLLTIKTN